MKKFIRNTLRWLFAAAVLFAVLSFTENVQSVSAASKPTVSATKKTVYVGGTSYTIKLKNTAKGYKVTFTSSDETIAKVDQKTGKVTAVAPGKAEITAEIVQDGKTYTGKVTITVKKPSIKFSAEAQNEMAAGDTQDLQGLIDGYGVTIDDDNITYKSSKKTYAKVSADGVVTALKAGVGKTVTITATDSESKLSCKLKITITAAAEPEEEKTDAVTDDKTEDTSEEETQTTVKEEPKKTVKVDRNEIKALFDKASQNIHSAYSGAVATGVDDAVDQIIVGCTAIEKDEFDICVKNADCLLTIPEYREMIPALESLKFEGVTLYSNGYVVKMSGKAKGGLTGDELAVLYAIRTGKTDRLSEQNKKLAESLQSCVDGCKTPSEEATAKNLHDWLLGKTMYSTTSFDDCFCDSIYACIMHKACDENGYVKTYLAMCELAGVECIRVDGKFVQSIGDHSWNKVKINGEWINVDIYADIRNAPSVRTIVSDYYGLTDADMVKYATTTGTYPEATTEAYGYAYKSFSELPRLSTEKELTDYLMKWILTVSQPETFEFIDPLGSTDLYQKMEFEIGMYGAGLGFKSKCEVRSLGIFGTDYLIRFTWTKKKK